MYRHSNLAEKKKKKKPLHGGYRDTTPQSGGGVEGWRVERVGGKRKKRGGRKTGPTELPCRRQQRQQGWKGGEGGGKKGEKDPGETLNRCVKPLSAFLLGNARSGASRKTI